MRRFTVLGAASATIQRSSIRFASTQAAAAAARYADKKRGANMRHSLISVSLVLLAGIALQVHAADTDTGARKQPSSTALDASNNPMKKCERDARKQKLRGAKRRSFMTGCLKGTTNATTDGSTSPDRPAMETPKP
jgi:hypothetical protein